MSSLPFVPSFLLCPLSHLYYYRRCCHLIDLSSIYLLSFYLTCLLPLPPPPRPRRVSPPPPSLVHPLHPALASTAFCCYLFFSNFMDHVTSLPLSPLPIMLPLPPPSPYVFFFQDFSKVIRGGSGKVKEAGETILQLQNNSEIRHRWGSRFVP